VNIIVGVSDMKVSNDPDDVLITYSLGSCIGISAYDAVAKVGGLLHFMLPESKLDEGKAQKNPFMFADTGIPAFFETLFALGAVKQRMKIVVTGGAQILDQKGFLNIGERNHMAVREIFSKHKVMIDYEEVGGNINRTIKLLIKNGEAWLKTSGQEFRKI
jgi:chemotaxis protein CheD